MAHLRQRALHQRGNVRLGIPQLRQPVLHFEVAHQLAQRVRQNGASIAQLGVGDVSAYNTLITNTRVVIAYIPPSTRAASRWRSGHA